MRGVIFLTVLAASFAAFGQEEAPPPPPVAEPPVPPVAEAPAPPPPPAAKLQNMSPPDTWEQRGQGTLRVMNKLDSTVQSLTLKVGETVQFETLAIGLSGCFVRPADLPADAAAHVVIADSRAGQPGYNGWILQKEPAAGMLEHPVYDVQLAGCG